jgi:hypothetical protein
MNGLAHMRRYIVAILCLLALVVVPRPAAAQDDIGNEYRMTVFPSARISESVTGFAYLGYVWNPDKGYKTYYLGWPAATYAPSKWVQIWGGLVGLYTNNETASDKLELRPFTGVKLFVPNSAKWNVYNFTRYEYRATQDRSTKDWTGVHRLRSRFGLEVPLASRDRAWQPGTFYALADVEPYYRLDKGKIDPLRVRAGLAYVLNSRLRMELIYHAQYTRPANSTGLAYTDNIYRLNIKIGLQRGILARLQNPEIDE